MKTIYTCLLLAFLITPLSGCGDQSGEILSDKNTPSEQTFLKDDLEPLEVKEISDDVSVNVYDDYQVVVADEGKMEVRLPLEVIVREPSYKQALFNAYIFGETQKEEGALVDGAGLIFQKKLDLDRDKIIENFETGVTQLIQLNGRDYSYYREETRHPDFNESDISIGLVDIDTGYAITCVSYGREKQKFADQCDDIIKNNIHIE